MKGNKIYDYDIFKLYLIRFHCHLMYIITSNKEKTLIN